MPLTIEEVTQKIDSFLQQGSQRYALQVGQQEAVIKEEFKKIIFSEQQECMDGIAKLPSNLAIDAQQLRLLRIGAELDLSNTKYSRFNSDCFNELYKALELGNISENLKHKIAYVSLAYYLSYLEGDVTRQRALKVLADTKLLLQQGIVPQFLVIDFEFLKLYYSFSILLGSLVPKNTEVHKLYDDLSLGTRFDNSKFAFRIDCIVRAIPYMTWIDVQDKIAIVTAYSMISKSSYEQKEFCEVFQLKKVIDFVTAAVNKNMNVFAKELEGKDRAQANQARQVYIAELQSKIKQIEESGEAEIKRINEQLDAVQQQEMSNINTAIAQAKRDAYNKAFGNTLKQAVGIAAGCFVGPAACGVLGVSAGAATAITSAAIGGATQTAITGGKLSDILKSAAIGGITGGIMSKVPVSGELAGSAKRIAEAERGVLRSVVSTGANTIVHGKGKLDPAAILGAGLAGASGTTMDGLAKDLTERAIKVTTVTAIHGGKLIPNLAAGATESASGYLGTTMGEEFKSKMEAERQLSSSKIVLAEPKSLQLDKQGLVIEQQEQEKLWQKMSLQEEKVKLINKITEQLVLLAKTQEFDLPQAIETVHKSIHKMNMTQFREVEKNFVAYFDVSANVNKPEIKQAVFEIPLDTASLEQTNGGRPGGYWIEPKIKGPFDEKCLNWWQRFKENYAEVTLTNDAIEQDLYKAQLAGKSLVDQFTPSEWQPLQSGGSVKTFTVGTEKDKNGKHHYRDLGTGQFSKSALEKAKESLQEGEQPSSNVDVLATEALHDKTRCYIADFGRVSTPEIETGFRGYICDNTHSGYSVSKDNVYIDGSIGGSVGVNLASGEVTSSVGTSRVDVDAFSGTLRAGGQIINNEKQLTIDGGITSFLQGPTVKAQFISKKRCTPDHCYQVTATPYAGPGVGLQLSGGYSFNKQTQHSTSTISVGVGTSTILGGSITVDKEPNPKSTNNSTSRPAI